jgi:RanBP-type and C3HC4-type zinc finger-containing protein 1
LSAREAESKEKNSYHCATPDCAGWCTFDDDVNTFFCYACRRFNCLTCRAVHDGQDCLEYQREMRAKAYSDPAAMIANSTLEELLKFGDAMKCPQCSVVIIKKDGCDWIQCTVCKTEICWVTRQARWGPKGHGDTSGGCRCNVNGRLCHPKCGNCH